MDDIRKSQLDETLDGKIQNAFEQLRSDNLFIWKQSLELAQREFSEKGVSQTMSMLPKTILDRGDLKRTVNSLILEESTVPKAQIINSKSLTQLSVQSQHAPSEKSQNVQKAPEVIKPELPTKEPEVKITSPKAAAEPEVKITSPKAAAVNKK